MSFIKRSRRIILLSILFCIACFLWWPLTLEDQPYSTVIYDTDGNLLSAQIATDGQWRLPLSDSVPTKFAKCITTFEDKRFYHHIGIDPLAILRAIRLNLTYRRIVSGASTIPMQIVRLDNGGKKRSIINKVKESLRAIRLDAQFSKEEILKIYASRAPFGGNVVGLETAAWRYFDKGPYQLSWAEMATLAVLPNAPSLIRIDKNRPRLLIKRNNLLHRLHLHQYIDDIELELAIEEPLGTGYYDLPNQAPHLLQAVKRNLYRKEEYDISTHVQRSNNDLLDRHYHEWSANGIHNAAILVKDNLTDKIIAYNANVPASTDEYAVDMIRAKRSSGSILKPILYAAAMQDGLITPDYWLVDIPTYINGFNPTNYYDTYQGLVSASAALSMSLNVPFVRLLQDYGVDKFRRRLIGLGFESVDRSADHYGLTLILGGAEVTLWDLVQGYSSMVGGLEHSNQDIYYDSGTIYKMLEAMGTFKRPDGHGDWEHFNSSHKISWKTGTSYGHRDAWAVGLSPQYTVGVWVGNADGEGREDVIGTSAAGTVLFEVFDHLAISSSWFKEPLEDMDQLALCSASGALASKHCPNIYYQSIPRSGINTNLCAYHQVLHVDSSHQWRVHTSCVEEGLIHQKSFLKLNPHIKSYYALRDPTLEDIPPLHPLCRSANYGSEMEFVYPNDGEKIYLPKDLNNKQQELIITVAHDTQEAEVFWYINDHYHGTTTGQHKLSFSYPKGIYSIYCVDQFGTSIARTFEIVSN